MDLRGVFYIIILFARIQVLLRQGFGIPSGNGKLLLAGKPRAQNRWVERMETRRENRRGLNKKRYPNVIRDNGHRDRIYRDGNRESKTDDRKTRIPE